MKRLFGTDGVRGVANADLTPDLVLALGRAAGRVLAPDGGDIVLGRDTRVSGPMLEAALVAGLCSAGADVRLVGILPSPAVAFLTQEEKARGGGVISASHNPIDDNGVKFFSEDGMKLPGAIEEQIEGLLEVAPDDLPTGAGVGDAEVFVHAGDLYVDHLLGTITEPLKGLRVVLDCAFGAAWHVGPRAFKEAGADVTVLNGEPDGRRINVDCGATSLGGVARAVVAEGADLGLAFDGDADRVLAVDERGEPVDGDQILALLALHLADEDALKHNLLVATVMTNLGFRRGLQERGIEVLTAPVGDKFVAEAMADRGAVLGGEQSGHIIFFDHATTGDGVLTGLQIAETLLQSGARLSELANVFERYPQVLINVRVAAPEALDQAVELWEDIRRVEERLGDEGRVLVRASGTEPLVRVMVEAPDEGAARRTAEELAGAVERHLGPRSA